VSAAESLCKKPKHPEAPDGDAGYTMVVSGAKLKELTSNARQRFHLP
jgi:hypothetical protein